MYFRPSAVSNTALTVALTIRPGGIAALILSPAVSSLNQRDDTTGKMARQDNATKLAEQAGFVFGVRWLALVCGFLW
jgi:hypothetical protein